MLFRSREHRALQLLRNLRFHRTDNDQILAYSKRHGEDTVLVVVNLDPHHTHEATLSLDLSALGLRPGDRSAVSDRIAVHDQLSGARYHWGVDNYVRLDPTQQPAHILTVRRADS